MNCVYCGKEFNPYHSNHKYCSNKCQKKVDVRKGLKKYTYVCNYCGKVYHPKQADRDKYCSRECYFKYKKENIEWKLFIKELNKFINDSLKKIRECKFCGKLMYNLSTFCCSNCYHLYHSNKKHTIIKRQCVVCGNIFYPQYKDKRKRYCSNRCAHSHSKRIRRARIKSGKKSNDKFTEYQVLIRDNFCCQVCGKKIDLTLSGGHNYSFSLDHIIPLSKGGTHTWNNVQSTHKICNSLKSDKIINNMA